MIEAFAVLLVAIPVINAFFVYDGIRRWHRVPSRILFAFAVVKVVIWGMGVYAGVLSLRYLLDIPGLPGDGIGLAAVLVAVSALPFYVWTVMRGIEGIER